MLQDNETSTHCPVYGSVQARWECFYCYRICRRRRSLWCSPSWGIVTDWWKLEYSGFILIKFALFYWFIEPTGMEKTSKDRCRGLSSCKFQTHLACTAFIIYLFINVYDSCFVPTTTDLLFAFSRSYPQGSQVTKLTGESLWSNCIRSLIN